MKYRDRLGIFLFLLFVLFAAVGCDEQAPSPEAETASAVTPTPTQVPTPAPADQFSAIAMPLPSEEWISRFSHMLSVLPGDYGPVLFLDMKELRYKPDVQEALRSQMAPALAAIPSAVTNLIEGAVLSTSGGDGGALVVLSTPLDIGTMLNSASSLQITSNIPEPEAYRNHQIWSFQELEPSLAIGSVDGTTSVAASVSSSSDASPATRVKSSLDTFAGLTPSLLESDPVSLMASSLPQGLVVAVFADCSGLVSLSAVFGLPNCNGAGVSAELLDQNVVAVNIVAGFQGDGLAEAALQTLNDEGIRLGESVPQDSAAKQEGSLIRVRQILDFDQVGEVFDAFAHP